MNAQDHPPSAYPELAKPLVVGGITIPNRFGMAPMTTNFAELDGAVSRSLVDYLAARARGGFGLVITENFGVHASGRVMPRMVMADDDRHIAGMAALAQAVKTQGAKIFGQLSHCGRQSRSAFTGGQLIAASAIPCPLNREVPRALTLEEIAEVQRWFVNAALRMEQAGFDGIELHAAHGYLLGGFLSNYSNTRQDAYGGPLPSRARMLLELVEQIRAKTRMAMSVRLSAEEFVHDGNRIEDAISISTWLKDAGVDAISVSVAVYESFNYMSMVGGEPEARWLHLSRAVRQATGLPVLVAGRIHDAARAHEAVLTGACDMPLFGRSAIADPDLPALVMKGSPQEVIPCIACNVCLGRSHRPETICPVNPRVGREAMFDAVLAQTDRALLSRNRLLIRGSSLASLTAGWIAARAGLSVVLEIGSSFGGLQKVRSMVPSQAKEYSSLLSAARLRAENAGVLFSGRPEDVASYRWVIDEEPEVVRRADPSTLWGAEALYADAALPSSSRWLDISTSELAVDAHPGYRISLATRLRELGFHFIKTSPARPKTSARKTGETRKPHFCRIVDAYEPGQMTAGVYDATERMFQLVRDARQDVPA